MPNQQPNLEQQVNQPLPPISSPPQKPKFNLKYILIVVILAAIVGGGILVYQYWWLPKNEIKLPEITIKDATANWQTYRNERLGFEIKYPENFKVRFSDYTDPETCRKEGGCYSSIDLVFAGEFFSEPESISSILTFGIFKTKFNDIDAWLEDNLLDETFWTEEMKKTISIDNISIGNTRAKKITWEKPDLGLELEAIKNDYLYRFNYWPTPLIGAEDLKEKALLEERAIVEQILSTFKFIEKADTSNWQTYRNEEYGFEVKYPKERSYGKEENYIYFLSPERVKTQFEGEDFSLKIEQTNYTDIQDWFNNKFKDREPTMVPEKSFIDVGGVNCLVISDPITFSGESYVNCIKSSRIYEIDYNQKFLPTFKFIK